MTGYAKDYIGQLCREGRVPARLVGRSWYVLETAIQDHRFGADIQPENAEPTTPPAWESPRYEASRDELLPSVNRLKVKADTENTEETKASERLEDTWRDWFDRIAAPTSEVGAPTESVGEETIEEPATAEEVNVPVRAVYQQPPEELLPRSIHVETRFSEEAREQPVRQMRYRADRKIVRAIQIGGILVAGIAAVMAAIGTGYLDEYIISNSQVRIIAGVGVYNK